jgi:hypothetical protein
LADKSAITDKAGAAFDDIFGLLSEKGVPDIICHFMAGLAFCVIWIVAELATVIGYMAVTLGAPLIDSMLEGVDTLRNDPSGSMNQLIGDVMGEFFGADFDTSNLSIAPGAAGTLERARAIGADVWGILEGEFAPNGTIDEAQGLLGAEAFIGFAANFSVRTAFLGIIGEMASLGVLTDMRQLGEELAKSLGLGRLMRLALAPLVKTTIADPLQWSLNRKYRPKRMAEAELVRAFRAGFISDSELADGLQQQGYRDSDIGIILNTADRFLSASELATLVRFGVWQPDTAVLHLKHQGYTEDIAKAILVAQDLQRAEVWVSEYLRGIQHQYTSGFLDEPAFGDLVDNAPVGDVEGEWVKLAATQVKKLGHRTLTLGTLERALEQDVIDIGEFRDWLGKEGYSADQITILLNLTLIAKAKIHTPAAPKPPKTPPATPPAA